ncbi:MAG: RNA polymerase sigma factor (sigma-70 family) [Myxococcota bacterium]|jgi:RNA polymerase sigma factor (sigma-70 family)
MSLNTPRDAELNTPRDVELNTLRDVDLVARASDGDMDACTTLYRRHVDTVHDHVARWTRDRALAADATQEAFVTLLRQLDTLRDGQMVLAWLMRTARNRAVHQLRRTEHEQPAATTPDLIDVSALTGVAPDRAGSPAREAEANEVAALLWTIAAGLDEQTFSVLDLTVRHGLNGPELAEALDTTPQNAKILVHQMREHVRSLFHATMLVTDDGGSCLDLAALQRTLPDPLDLPAARALEAHADACATCEPQRRGAVAPMRAYAAFAVLPAPTSVRISIETAMQAQSAGAAASRSRMIATAFGVVLLVLAGVRIAGGEPAPDGPAVAVGIPLADTTEPAPSPSLTADTTPTETPTIIASTEAPTDAPTSTPTATPTATPSDASSEAPSEASASTPTEAPDRAPLSATIASPLPESVLVAGPSPTGGPAVATVTLDGVIAGADGAADTLTVVWTTDRKAEPLSDQLRANAQLAVSEPCVDIIHVLTLTVTDTTTGEIAIDSLPVTLTEACPAPLEVRILVPDDESEHEADGLVTGSTRQTANVDVTGEAESDTGGDLAYSWRTDRDPGANLLQSAAGTVTLWVDRCQPLRHALTLTVTDPETGATGSATIYVTVICPGVA